MMRINLLLPILMLILLDGTIWTLHVRGLITREQTMVLMILLLGQILALAYIMEIFRSGQESDNNNYICSDCMHAIKTYQDLRNRVFIRLSELNNARKVQTTRKASKANKASNQ